MKRSRGSFGRRLLLELAGAAGAAYWASGADRSRRLAMLRDALASRVRRFGDFLGGATADLGNRSTGVLARTRGALGKEPVSDETLEQRVRSRLGRAASHPSSVEVDVQEGRVALRGPVLTAEAERVLRAVASVPGVAAVEDHLVRHESSAGVPGLQGGEVSPRPQASWAPGNRLAAGVMGGGLALLGARRLRAGSGGGAGGFAALAVGSALLMRATANRPLHRALRLDGARETLEVKKSLEIEAPVGEVFALWSGFENFPLFMDHVLEVHGRGGGLSHWKVRSAAGTAVEWDAEITQLVPDRVLAWRTLGGGGIQHSGIVHFEPLGPRRTRIDVQLSYSPPGGILGHGAAMLFGVDPKRALDEDLVRLKSILEEGKTTAHGARITREEVASGTPARH